MRKPLNSKAYTTENAYRSHINSKKHKDNELRAAQRPKDSPTSGPIQSDEVPSADNAIFTTLESENRQEPTASSSKAILTVDADADEEEVMKTIDEKIAAARSRLSPKHCLFCPASLPTLDDNLTHMNQTHSFFIPDAEYLVDLQGLITYLGEKIAIGNVCIYCNTKSREFRTMDAVRKHMVDKSHCKIAYDTETDRLEISDYYDFSSSYPDYETRKARKAEKAEQKRKERENAIEEENEEWEDMEEDGEEIDEIIEENGSGDDDDDDDDSLPDNELAYGDTDYELVLPSGARIGHRSLRRYYSQSYSRSSLVPRGGKEEDPNSGVALVRRLLADKNSALVPRKGGFGAFGSGTDVVKARNRGEAREAGRHVREFRDQNRREQFKTKIAYINNHQKHFRDPLLQVSSHTFIELHITLADEHLFLTVISPYFIDCYYLHYNGYCGIKKYHLSYTGYKKSCGPVSEKGWKEIDDIK